jgi:hypothetical protein
VSRWRLASPFAHVQSHPSVARVIRSPRVFPNRWSRGWWEALRANQPSRASSHRTHDCDQPLTGRETHTSPSLRYYGWKCPRRPWPLECHRVQDSELTPRSRAAMARRMKTAASLAIYCHQNVYLSLSWTG